MSSTIRSSRSLTIAMALALCAATLFAAQPAPAQGGGQGGGRGGRGGGSGFSQRDTTPPRDLGPKSPLPTGRVTYRTLIETNIELERIAAAYPDRVKRFALPNRSLLGQTVWALEISHNVNASAWKPAFLMTGLQHSREWPTVDLTMEFVNDILMNDRTDARISQLLDNARLLVVPVVNPDGYEMSRTLLIEQKRRNCRVEDGKVPTFADCANPTNRMTGVDLNRNYAAFWGGSGASVSPKGDSYRGAAPFSEPEVRNIRDLMATNQIVVALSNHTPDERVLRAPSAVEEPVPADIIVYDSLAQALGRDLNWRAGPWPEIYYTASGTMEEFAYYTAGTLSFTFENTPGGRGFHPAYPFVVDQYTGTGAYPGSNARNAFMRLLEATTNPALHSVLKVKAPAGAILTISKRFDIESSPLLKSDNRADSLARDPAIRIPTSITSTLTVPVGASEVTWHVNPSLRASQHEQAFLQESWTLSCSSDGKTQSTLVKVARGETANVDMRACGRGK
ncbi:MAG: hypothetical protein IT356_09320 [Gemmatimonadaceae bacterium]|nr:hypothetical protein [Gemmatimonadaceae bacterium]